METTILLIEDDKKIANFITMALKIQGYKITSAFTGQSGIMAFCTQTPDIILLDLGLPDMDGTDIIAQIRQVSQVPILVVSAREFEQDKIAALDAGANDYVTKPFSMGELLARVRVMERFIIKEAISMSEYIYHFEELTVDIQRHRIFLENQEIHLTPLEYNLLLLLVKNHGKVLTHSQIIKDVWGYPENGDAKSIRVCMASLRRKIEKDTSHPHFILTEIGIGYRFMDN
ncbi:MAG: response regulator [Lachnospiraceae bacterium]